MEDITIKNKLKQKNIFVMTKPFDQTIKEIEITKTLSKNPRINVDSKQEEEQDPSGIIQAQILKLLISFNAIILLEQNNLINIENISFINHSQVCEIDPTQNKFKLFNLNEKVDLIICIGGDGSLLWTNKHYKNKELPPCVCVSAGTLGFLMDHEFSTQETTVYKVISGNNKQIAFNRHIASGQTTIINSEVHEKVQMSHQYINEIVISRQDGNLIVLDVQVDEVIITSVWADGLIIATSNGSTAQSLSAHGSIVHPSVECILITPICAFSLNSRPIILPNSNVKIKVSEKSRSNGKIMIDGNSEQQLMKDDQINVNISDSKLNRVISNDMEYNWYKTLGQKLGWMKFG